MVKIIEKNKVFYQVNLYNSKEKTIFLRVIFPSATPEDLDWHFENTNRKVYVLGGAPSWSFQFDNEFPLDLYTNSLMSVPKGAWHRLIRNRDKVKELKLLIIETP
jgi:cytochrome c oxidase assembly protein Cox11